MRLLLLFLLSYDAVAHAKKLTPALELKKFEQCSERPATYYHDKSELVNFTIAKISRNVQVVNGMIIFRNVAKYPQMRLQISRCSTSSGGSCEIFMNVKQGICKMFADTDMFYTGFFKGFQPPPSCPAKNGVRHIVNATFDAQLIADLMMSIPGADNFFWTLRAKGLDENGKENAYVFVMIKMYYSRY